jgi:hypothetical protein
VCLSQAVSGVYHLLRGGGEAPHYGRTGCKKTQNPNLTLRPKKHARTAAPVASVSMEGVAAAGGGTAGGGSCSLAGEAGARLRGGAARGGREGRCEGSHEGRERAAWRAGGQSSGVSSRVCGGGVSEVGDSRSAGVRLGQAGSNRHDMAAGVVWSGTDRVVAEAVDRL